MSDLISRIRRTDRRAFLATGSEAALTVHSVKHGGAVVMADEGISLRRYPVEDLVRAQTLEDLSSSFGQEPILYDPTRIVRRLRGLVRLAAAFRRASRHDISQIVYEPRSRTVYVKITEGSAAAGDERIGKLLRLLALAAQRWQTSGIDCHLSVRLCETFPPASLLVPVDRRSIGSSLTARIASGWQSVLAVIGFSAAVATPAAAEAVKQTNLTTYVDVTVNSGTKGDFGGQLALPITGSLGAQIDLGGGTDGYLGGGGQLFLRDRNLGLIGLTASIEALDDKTMYRIGAKAEYYLDKLTIGGNVGYQSLDQADGTYGGIDLRFYATPDFALRGGAELSPDLQLYSVGAEWRLGFDALPGLSIYSDVEHSSEGDTAARIGLIYHFGENGVSLMSRDRNMKTGTTIFNRMPFKYVS